MRSTSKSSAQPTLLFIPDISGFTKFVHETEITHSEHIIAELLESLIDANEMGLEVSEIEGDAILFYRAGKKPTVVETLAQVQRMYIKFHSALLKYESQRICQCGACIQANDLVKDINLGPSGSQPMNFTKSGENLFFVANDGNGPELWNTDGSEMGTYLVKDIDPTGFILPEGLTDYNGTLYFRANDGISGYEMWKSDGTEAGTDLVTGINPAGSSLPSGFTELDGTLFFRARDENNDVELWSITCLPVAIPTLSEWGMLILLLVILIGGVIMVNSLSLENNVASNSIVDES